eukprot:CAMPEP_0171310744 /NCGR_PEP_ID=MMETSP0816-20121228/20934_1 /TAXON_ID=420281 /ORGANISM="Proboscia inermis, Strain CCAP1064/1" /LENGTH=158 /DNA_ID=CAMNT_0011795047 /DNA_START=522 /DNA_END=999 /DNA_ORIENTATION=-
MTIYNQVAVAMPSKAVQRDLMNNTGGAASNISRPGSWMTAASFGHEKNSTRPLSGVQPRSGSRSPSPAGFRRSAGSRVGAVPSMRPLLESSSRGVGASMASRTVLRPDPVAPNSATAKRKFHRGPKPPEPDNLPEERITTNNQSAGASMASDARKKRE